MLSKVILILFVSATIQGPVKSNYVLNNVEYPPEEYCPSFYDKWCSKWSHSLNNKTSLFTFRVSVCFTRTAYLYVNNDRKTKRLGNL